jgi:hypothetical protein
VVSPPYAIANPRTVVIHAQDADTTPAAMMSTLGPQLAAHLALACQSGRPTSLPGIRLGLTFAPRIRRGIRCASCLEVPVIPLGGLRGARISERRPKVARKCQHEKNIEENRPSYDWMANDVIDVPLAKINCDYDKNGKSPHLT